MMQNGRCNVPIDRIPALALACGVPADEFIRLAMSEYNPAVWAVLAKVVAQRPSADEREWLTIYEALSKSRPVTVDAGLWLDVFMHARSVIEKRGAVQDSSG
jgi:hypothetical protein